MKQDMKEFMAKVSEDEGLRFKCNYQQDNTLCCASCAYSRFSYPNLYCFLDKNEGGPKPAEVMPLQSNGNLQ